jgi:predicted dienelactone hydrolase
MRIHQIALVAVTLALSLPVAAQELVTVPRSDGAEVPLRVYPTDKPCTSLAVISPGAGGTEEGYTYLATGLHDRGGFAVVMGDKESGPATLRKDIRSSGIHGGLKDMVTDTQLQQDRILDLNATLAWGEQRCHNAYKVLLGHSMGSDTVMFEAGARNKLQVNGKDRFDAYVAISPSGHGSIFTEGSWSNIHKPMYVLTGTRDKGLEGTWEWRTEPFYGLPKSSPQGSSNGCHWLGVIDGATHLNFAGIGMAGPTRRLTLESVDAYLRAAQGHGDCAAPAQQRGITITVQDR